MPEKKKSSVQKKRKRSDEEQKKQKQNKINDDVSPPPRYLPEELIIENILPRLSAPVLGRFSAVSKLWHQSIDADTRFAVSYLAHHDKNSDRSMCLDLLNVSSLNVPENNDGDTAADANDIEHVVNNYSFRLLQKRKGKGHFYNFENLWNLDSMGYVEPVGNCKGLTCLKNTSSVFGKSETLFLINPIRKETLKLTCLKPEVEGVSLKYMCHGFGFDSSSKVYKVVVIYTTLAKHGGQGFICMVFTSGDNSWKKIATRTCDVSPPPGCPPFASQMVTEIWNNDHKSATICRGDLLWRVTTTGDGDKKEMLLLFDINNDRLQFIRLLDECNSLVRPMVNREDREIAHHLLEFKGYPCVARSERILRNNYKFEVHMYVMKDKVEQTWVEEETFKVTLPQNFVENFTYTTTSNNRWSRPTRMFSFSDQPILYWFDGECLVFYNLQMKHYKVVQGESSKNVQIRGIFKTKMRGPKADDDDDGDDDDDDTDCPWIDYQLHAQVESIISLKTFIHKQRDICEFDDYEQFRQFVSGKELVGWVDTGRKPPKWYAFF